jgi:hypothetical protein
MSLLAGKKSKKSLTAAGLIQKELKKRAMFAFR